MGYEYCTFAVREMLTTEILTTRIRSSWHSAGMMIYVLKVTRVH